MIRPLLAIGALVVLAAVEARYEDGGRVSYKHEEHYSYEPYGDNKYDDGYGKKHVAYAKSYKHEPEHYEEYEEPSYGKYDHKPTYKHRHSVYGYGGDSYGKSYSSYEEPTYAKSHKVPTYEVEYHDEDYGYEHKYDHKPSYNSHKYKRSVYGYSDDSYGKSYNFYGGDSYGKSYSTYSSYKPSSYRHKREEQVLVPLGIEREGLQRPFRKIQSIVTKTGEQPNADTDSPIAFSISGEAVSGTDECKCNATLIARGKDSFKKGAVNIFGRIVLEATGDKDCYGRSCSGRPIVTLDNKGGDSWNVEWVEINFDDGSSCRSKGRIGWLDDETKQDPITCCERSWTGTLC